MTLISTHTPSDMLTARDHAAFTHAPHCYIHTLFTPSQTRKHGTEREREVRGGSNPPPGRLGGREGEYSEGIKMAAAPQVHVPLAPERQPVKRGAGGVCRVR